MAAHTIFNLIRRYDGFSLLEADLKTGRTHQIRVHLAHLGFPIVGDEKYGDFDLNKALARGGLGRGPRLGRMFLHSGTISFSHPVTGRPMTLAAALPPECSNFLKGLDAAV
jgi:23S rRNA pseudouridine955/2504/2580 synthase